MTNCKGDYPGLDLGSRPYHKSVPTGRRKKAPGWGLAIILGCLVTGYFMPRQVDAQELSHSVAGIVTGHGTAPDHVPSTEQQVVGLTELPESIGVTNFSRHIEGMGSGHEGVERGRVEGPINAGVDDSRGTRSKRARWQLSISTRKWASKGESGKAHCGPVSKFYGWRLPGIFKGECGLWIAAHAQVVDINYIDHDVGPQLPLRVAFTGHPEEASGAPQRPSEDSDDHSGGGADVVVRGVFPKERKHFHDSLMEGRAGLIAGAIIGGLILAYYYARGEL